MVLGNVCLMSRKFFSVFAGLAVVALALVGCSGPSDGGSSTGSAGSTGSSASTAGEKIKVGFIVKSLADSWFQPETQFAKEEADKIGVDLLVEEATDGSKVLDAINTMATQGAKGIIICAPEVQLGPAIEKACKDKNLKLMSVDDRLVGTDGKPLAGVPHLGISATKIGESVGTTIVEEMKKRGWVAADVHGIATTKEELETAMQRIDGCKSVLVANGIPAGNIHYTPWKTLDITGATDAANTVITQNQSAKHWVCFSSNDDGMMGAVRALEARGVKAENIIGVGINGLAVAKEFALGKPSGVFASILLKPRIHGAQTVNMMAAWIKDGKEPPIETYTEGTAITRDNYESELKTEGMSLD